MMLEDLVKVLVIADPKCVRTWHASFELEVDVDSINVATECG